jgi:hypothetical protein
MLSWAKSEAMRRKVTVFIGVGLGTATLAVLWFCWMGPSPLHIFQGSVFVGLALVIGFFVIFGSAKERAFERECQGRPEMDDTTFFKTFYEGTDVPKAIPLRLRKVWAKELGRPWTKIFPHDNPFQIFPADLDMTSLVVATEREFGVVFRDEDRRKIDGSFDSVVKYLVNHVTASEDCEN